MSSPENGTFFANKNGRGGGMTSVASMQLTASGAVAVQIVPDDLSNPWAFSPSTFTIIFYFTTKDLLRPILNYLAGVEGFEPPTIGFGDRCSTNWNYTPADRLNYTDGKRKVK